MFIELKDIVQKYKMTIRGVVHLGAHQLEELSVYRSCNINNVVWVEGNDDLIPRCREILKETNSNDILLNYLVYDTDNIDLEFKITNNTQSSSILPFGKHKQYYSYVDFVKTITKKAFTLKTILNENNIDITKYNMLNIDLQGVELRALKGLGELINNIDYIYSEVNNDNIYEGNDYIADIDVYLEQHGFVRAETFMLSEQWGDALYIRKNLLS